jgi:hypothetical protein
VAWPGLLLRLGMSQIGIRASRYVRVVVLPDWLVAGDVTNWYHSHGFDVEPRWAMLVVNETNIPE